MSAGPPQLSDAEVAEWLAPPARHDHKYSRGVLAVRTGSVQYPGAAVLSVEAAWRTGIGMVRYIAPADESAGSATAPSSLVLARRPETVTVNGNFDALLAGSGVDPEEQPFQDRAEVAHALAGLKPVMLDAGALALLLETGRPKAPTIITPHQGEFTSLWRSTSLAAPAWLDDGSTPSPAERKQAVTRLAHELGVTVLLKGSQTIVVSPSGEAVQTELATPLLATAGTGDVLGGVLGALVAAHAQRVRQDESALVWIGAAAAHLHDTAARLASGELVPGDVSQKPHARPITALDVAEALPLAVQLIRSRADRVE